MNAKFNHEKDLSVITAEAGMEHPGFDCFIFKRDLVEKMVFGDVVLGLPGAGNDLFFNLFCLADNPVLYTQKHLTFHVGTELVKRWGTKEEERWNFLEYRKVVAALESRIAIAKFPGSGRGFLTRHFKWLMNPTIHYPTMLKADLKQLGTARKRQPKTEVKGFTQRYFEWLITLVSFRERE